LDKKFPLAMLLEPHAGEGSVAFSQTQLTLDPVMRAFLSHRGSSTIQSKVVSYFITSVGHGADPGFCNFLAVRPQVTLVISPAVGCRYFPPGPLLLPAKKIIPFGRYQIVLLGDHTASSKMLSPFILRRH